MYCKPAYFCSNRDIKYEILQNDELTLNNWVQDFDLVCDSHLAISFYSMSWIIGFLVGFFILPYFQDNYGRKYVYTISIFIIEIIMIIITFLPRKNSTKWTLYLLIFITGLFSCARFTTGYNYLTEMWPAKNLSTVSSLNNVLEGLIIISISTYYMTVSKDWEPILYYAATTGLIAMTLNCVFLPESPKWLYSKGKYELCARSLSRLAKMNGIKQTPMIDSLKCYSIRERVSRVDFQVVNQSEVSKKSASSQVQSLQIEQGETEKVSALRQIVDHRIHLLNLIAMCAIWTSASFGYYLIGFQTKYIPGNFFINNITSASSELMSYILSGLMF